MTVAVAGVEQTAGTDYVVNTTSGLVTFLAGHIPPAAASITAGFEFDVPWRFDTDKLEVNVTGFHHGAIPNIPGIDVRV